MTRRRYRGFLVDSARWDAVEAATFASMKERADHLAPNADKGLRHSNERFFAEGRLGAWQAVVPADVLERYDERIRQLSDDPAFTSWLHDGRHGA